MLKRLTADEYRDQLAQLLPKGKLWERVLEGRLGQVLHALADEFARVHDRAQDVLEEADPRTADELLEGWERVAGLDGKGTDDERRAVLWAHLTARGGQSSTYYIGLASNLGVEVTIETVTPFRCDRSTVETPLYDDEWAFVWWVTGPAATSATVQAQVEALFQLHRPAHTIVHFAWTA